MLYASHLLHWTLNKMPSSYFPKNHKYSLIINRSHKIPGLRTSANWFEINILTYWTCKCTDIKPNKHWFVQPQSHLWSHFLSVNSLKKTTNWKKKGGCEVSSSDSHSNVYMTKNTNILLWQPNLSLCSRVNTCIQKFPFKLIDLI